MSESPAAPVESNAPQPSGGALSIRGAADIALPVHPGMAIPAQPPAPDASAEGGIDARRILHALRRRWLTAIIIGSLAAALVAIPTWFLLPRGFEAVVWLRVRSAGGMLGSGSNPGEYESYRKTQLQLLRSPLVLNAALRRPGISSLKTITDQDDPVTWLGKTLSTAVQAESEVMQLKLRTPVAEDSAKILNAVTQCYLDDIVNKDRQDRLGRRDMLEKKYKENQTELRSRRETFNELARTLGTRDSSEVATQRALLLDHLGGLRRLISDSERSLAMIDTELAVRDADSAALDADEEAGGVAEGSGDELLELALSREPEVRELQDQIDELDTAIADQSARSARGLNDRAVKRLIAQRSQAAGQLDRLRDKLRPRVSKMMASGGNNSLGRTGPTEAGLKVQRAALLKTIEDSRDELDQVTKEVSTLGKANADLEVRKGEIEQLQRVTDQIGLQLESTALDLTAPPRVVLLEEAAVPESNDLLQRFFLTSLAGIVGLALGGGSVILFEYLRNRLSSADEVPQRVGLRLIGTLPWIGKTRKGRSNEYLMAESVDSIRTLVLHGAREAPKVIMVTSPGEREGKSSVAANLAASIARADKRTLLVEGSLRNPSVHAALQLDPATIGMGELLRGENSLDEVIQPTAIEGLFAVTAGNVDYAAVNAYSRADFARIMQGFRDSFDHVVIDAGPVLAYADTMLIGQRSDITILSAMRDVSNVAALTAATDKLRSAGVRVLGCVVSGTPSTASSTVARRLQA